MNFIRTILNRIKLHIAYERCYNIQGFTGTTIRGKCIVSSKECVKCKFYKNK